MRRRMEVLESIFLENSLRMWLVALGVFLGTWLLLRVAQIFLRTHARSLSLQRTTLIRDLLVELLGTIHSAFITLISLYVATLILEWPPRVELLIHKTAILVVLVQLAVSGRSIIAFLVDGYLKSRMADDAASVTTISLVSFLLRMSLFVILLLFGLNNVGVDITALIAGLGVGGVAIALAVRNTLSDLFASLTIVLDKPFLIGDFIVVGEFQGTVEQIGLKTTRIRSVSGEQLVFPNADLLQSRIRNFKTMQERRAVLTVAAVQQTPYERLARIPAMIREAIESRPEVRFERAHFKGFESNALQFEAVYWVKTPDYRLFMDTQQAVNLDVFWKFAAAGIQLAGAAAPAPMPGPRITKESAG